MHKIPFSCDSFFVSSDSSCSCLRTFLGTWFINAYPFSMHEEVHQCSDSLDSPSLNIASFSCFVMAREFRCALAFHELSHKAKSLCQS